jgi:hypothetical protein
MTSVSPGEVTMKLVVWTMPLFAMLQGMAYSSEWKCVYSVPSVVTYTDPKTGEPKTVSPKNAGECQRKIDTANLKYTPKRHVRVWVSTKMSHGDKGSVWRKDLYEIDCINQKWRFLQIGFDMFADDVPPEGPFDWYWTEPDSSESALSEAVCKH